MPKFRKLSEEEVRAEVANTQEAQAREGGADWTTTQEGMEFQPSKRGRGRPKMPQSLRDKVVFDYQAQVTVGGVVTWRFSASEVAGRNKVSVTTMHVFLREAGVPNREERAQKGEPRERHTNRLADLEWRLNEIAAMYNAVNRRGERTFTLSQVAEKYLVSNQTIVDALKIAQNRGIRVDWRRETNSRIVRS